MKGSVPNWVIRNLNDYGNCALPNAYTEMNRTKLVEKLSKALGRRVSVRECQFHHKEDYTFGSLTKTQKGVKTYLVAEVEK